ncbi:MAG: hypothetical protein ABI723_15490 [Bacteroidia bacterium]
MLFNWIDEKLGPRNLINKDSEKVTYVQIMGFILIGFGVSYIMFFQFPKNEASSNGMAASFFLIMLGMSMSFPSLLKGQTKDVSTMRIIVFMFANVICMLLLKIGWDKHSLSEIGLDGYWMGVIAFLFGAKATQAFFENADKFFSKKQITPQEILSETVEKKDLDISQIAIAQLAKIQNESKLQTKFPNIVSVSDTLLGGKCCLTLYLEDNNGKNIPEFVTAEINEKTKVQVRIEVITDSPAAITHIGQATDELSDSDNPEGFASFCALLSNTDNIDLKFLATAGHNFTNGNFKSMGGFIFDDEQRAVFINGKTRGSLFYQRMHFTQDLAIVKLSQTDSLLENYISFNSGYKELSTNDVKTKVPNVTIASRKNINRNGSNIHDAFVLDINIPFDVMYNGEKRRLQNVILLGDTNEPDKSKEVSMRGDSGSPVYCNQTKKLIGILIGGNGKFSFVLPLKDVLETNNFKLI